MARFQLRFELTNASIGFHGQLRGDAVAEVLDPGPRRGYAVVAGRDLHFRGSEVMIEKAFADSWGIRLGDEFYVRGLGELRVVGLVEAPDNVGYPLAKPRFYVSRGFIEQLFGRDPNPAVNVAEIWLRNPAYLNEVLVQARETSFGLASISYATRSGVRILLDQAAGIVIDLLVALSVIALVTAGVMLASSARAEVQRRLSAFGVRRAIGSSRGFVTLTQAVEGLLVAVPATTLGVLAGFAATAGPSARLLELLNEPAPGVALAAPAARRVAGGRARAGVRCGVAGVASGAGAGGRAASRRRCLRPRVPPGADARGRPRVARGQARRRPARPFDRDRADARAVGRVRAAGPRARF